MRRRGVNSGFRHKNKKDESISTLIGSKLAGR